MKEIEQTSLFLDHWDLGKPAALTLTSSLISSFLMEASVTSGFAAETAEVSKHNSNDAKCSAWLDMYPYSSEVHVHVYYAFMYVCTCTLYGVLCTYVALIYVLVCCAKFV